MAITYESQVYVECDYCGDYEHSSTVTVAEMKSKLRSEGWSIGKYVKCPKCKNSCKGKPSMYIWCDVE